MTGKGKWIQFALAIFVLGTMVSTANAQVTTGTVAGTVTDTSGGVLPGATVTLISESQNTRTTPAVTNATGDFVLANLRPDTYTVEVTMPSFKTLKKSNIPVNPGSRVVVDALVLEIGGTTEVVNVRSEAPLIQAQSGERSFSITTESVQNLPISSRSFTQLAILAPGVTVNADNTPLRMGGGGDPNIMMDGVSTMDTGSNRPLLQMNTESIAEVKVLTSGYQAEYGRASGVQISAVTKSGTNRFRGSVYDVERNSDWNPNSKTNNLNGNPKAISKERDWGFSIGGPIGKPGGNNRLFFFYAHEFAPRTQGNNVQNFRMPTPLERQGNFSQTTDNNGALYPYIKDPRSSAACTAANTTGCYQDGGIVGKIPADQLYGPGLAILNRYPLPNIDNVPAGQNYNYTITRPAESITAWQPAVRIDYQVNTALRASFKYSAWGQQDRVFNGTIPGWNDTKMQAAPVLTYTGSVNYTLTPTMFIEATYGHSQNELAGCAQAQSSTGAIFCNNNAGTQGIPMNATSSLAASGLADLPFLYPNATVLPAGYYAIEALNGITPPFWDGTRMAKVPTFAFGGRVANAPPTTGFPGWFNINRTDDFSVSLTKVWGRHTLKAGFYNTHSYKAEQTSNDAFGTINFQQEAAGTNLFDTSFGYSNAAVGAFSSYTQAQLYVETSAVYNNREFYVQDNWKVTNRLTLDYGARFVNQQPQYDELGQASNFLFDKWTIGAAPALYYPGCAVAQTPGTACPTASLQARNPQTGQLLGPNTSAAVGTLVPNSGNELNGLYLPGQEGLPRATFSAPVLAVAPRFGMAYDITGQQKFVLRGGVGLFYDRPSSTTVSGGVRNPPTSKTITVRYSQLQSLSGAGLTTQGAPAIQAFPVDQKLPTSTQWNSGMQMALPFAMSLDVAYVGQHSFNTFVGTDVNAVDFGATFLPENQNPTAATSTVPGASAYQTELLRSIRGYNALTYQWQRGWRTYHSLQLSLQRRFQNGLSFGFTDTIGLSDKQQSGARLVHASDGSFAYRDDQGRSDELLGNNNPQAHVMRTNFVWDLPDLHAEGGLWRAVGLVVNDWQLSGIWTAATGTAYTVGFTYQTGGGNQNLTGSPNYAPRVYVLGDPGSGCSSNVYKQFETSVFQGPNVNSDGLESGNSYLRSCFSSVLDLAIARNIRLGGGRSIQLRVDMFNAPNEGRVTGRNTTMNLTTTADPITITNPVFGPDGEVLPNRVRPNQAGFGAVNGYQNPRAIQMQIRFSF